jgi:large subunit ribosomal protein L33
VQQDAAQKARRAAPTPALRLGPSAERQHERRRHDRRRQFSSRSLSSRKHHGAGSQVQQQTTIRANKSPRQAGFSTGGPRNRSHPLRSVEIEVEGENSTDLTNFNTFAVKYRPTAEKMPVASRLPRPPVRRRKNSLKFAFNLLSALLLAWSPDCRGFLMAKSKKKVETVFLVCEETGDHNYTIRRKSGGEKLKIKKYSPRLRRHTLHAEKKK